MQILLMGILRGIKMKASKLISLLMEEVLSKGDGDVVFDDYLGNGNYQKLNVGYLLVNEDEDHSGKVTKRTFVLQQ